MSFPPPATDAIDWANVGFKIREGTLSLSYSPSTDGAL